MIIGIDGSRAFLENRTGTENYSYQLIRAIAEIDISRASSSQELGVENNDIERYNNQYIVYLRTGQDPGKNWPKNFRFKIINYRFLWTQVGLSLRTFIDRLDILFVPAHTLPLIRNPFLKTVITVHDLGAEYLPLMHQIKQVLYLKLMTHYQIKTASKIIAVSKATKKDLVEKIGIKGEKIRVIYEGVDKEVFSHQSSAISKGKNDSLNSILNKYGLEKGKYFLFVGTIQPRKNLERLVKAFERFIKEINGTNETKGTEGSTVTSLNAIDPFNSVNSFNNFKLLLVGQKGWNSESIYSLPAKLEIEDKVKFTGRISDEGLAVLYKNAAALTYPSLFEGFGLPILEAFASGCPVITSNSSSMPEIAGNAAILVDPLNENQIKNAMVKVISNDVLRNSLVINGYSRLKQFSWEKTAKETLEVIKGVNGTKVIKVRNKREGDCAK